MLGAFPFTSLYSEPVNNDQQSFGQFLYNNKGKILAASAAAIGSVVAFRNREQIGSYLSSGSQAAQFVKSIPQRLVSALSDKGCGELASDYNVLGSVEPVTEFVEGVTSISERVVGALSDKAGKLACDYNFLTNVKAVELYGTGFTSVFQGPSIQDVARAFKDLVVDGGKQAASKVAEGVGQVVRFGKSIPQQVVASAKDSTFKTFFDGCKEVGSVMSHGVAKGAVGARDSVFKTIRQLQVNSPKNLTELKALATNKWGAAVEVGKSMLQKGVEVGGKGVSGVIGAFDAVVIDLPVTVAKASIEVAVETVKTTKSVICSLTPQQVKDNLKTAARIIISSLTPQQVKDNLKTAARTDVFHQFENRKLSAILKGFLGMGYSETLYR